MSKFVVPKNISLNEDIKLDTVSYLDNRNKNMLFPNTEQKLLLTIVQGMMVSKPEEELHYEELKPFLDLVLTQNNTWPVRAATLLLRCKLEGKLEKTKYRALRQLKELMSCYTNEQPHPLTRIGGVYGTGLQPTWKTEMQYIDMMLKVGTIKPALVKALRLESWEQIITCFTALNMKTKALNLIKKQYEGTNDTKFLCWIGKFYGLIFVFFSKIIFCNG